MKKLRNYYANLRHPNPSAMERRWVFPLANFPNGLPDPLPLVLPLLLPLLLRLRRVRAPPHPNLPLPPPPQFAYLVSGSAGDGRSPRRTLLALYHPHNQYVVHLDLASSAQERLELLDFVRNHPVFRQFGNVKSSAALSNPSSTELELDRGQVLQKQSQFKRQRNKGSGSQFFLPQILPLIFKLLSEFEKWSIELR